MVTLPTWTSFASAAACCPEKAKSSLVAIPFLNRSRCSFNVTDDIMICRSLTSEDDKSARIFERKVACFWLFPSRTTRSPDRMVDKSSFFASRGSTILPTLQLSRIAFIIFNSSFISTQRIARVPFTIAGRLHGLDRRSHFPNQPAFYSSNVSFSYGIRRFRCLTASMMPMAM